MRILLVEDNDIMRQAIREALALHDFEVDEVRDGRDALSAVREQKGQFNLIISDLVMPHMNALELYEGLEQLERDVRMLIVTGYPMPQSGKSLVERPGVTWMQRPVHFEKLGTIVRDLVDGEE